MAIDPLLPDQRNNDIFVHVGGRLVPRDEAKVSVFDSSVQGGDAVWEGLRVYEGRVFRLHAHLARLQDSAKAMAFADVPTSAEIERAVLETLRKNGMYDGAHVRLTLTRGRKTTSGMSPKFNRYGCTLIVLAEWKAPVYGQGGLVLVASSVRRNGPSSIDSKIHHNNLVNNILAKIEANNAGADDALMLDMDGFVAETNATNVFLVKNGVLKTPHADACLPGITRGVVLDLARGNGIPCEERRLSLMEFHTADEVFTTGTMGELSWVKTIDGRAISAARGPVTERLCALYREETRREGAPVPR